MNARQAFIFSSTEKMQVIKLTILVINNLIQLIMAKYSGKDEKINGKWYPVTVKASTVKEAINKLYVGQQKSYGTVQAIRGRFSKED